MLKNTFWLNIFFFSNLLLAFEKNDVEFTIFCPNIEIMMGEKIDYKIICKFEPNWYTVKEEASMNQSLSRNINDCFVEIDWDNSKSVPLYQTTKNGKNFKHTQEYLEQSEQNKIYGLLLERFCVLEYRMGYFRIKLNDSANKKRRAWINRKDVSNVYQIEINNTENKNISTKISKLNLINLFNQPGIYLPQFNVLLTDKLYFILRFDLAQYKKNNCGIHALLTALIINEPKILNEWLKNPNNILCQLEHESLHNNPERLVNIIESTSMIAFSSFMSLTGEYLNPLLCMSVGASFGYGLHSLVTNIETSVRKNIGIMPKKLEKLGNYALKINKLEHKIKFVKAEKNDLNETYKHWRKIINKGSPIIFLKPGFASAHYVVIYAILESNDILIIDEGSRSSIDFQYLENMVKNKKDWFNESLFLLAGANHNFVYFYFKEIQN